MPASSSMTRCCVCRAAGCGWDRYGQIQGQIDFRHGRNSSAAETQDERLCGADGAIDMNLARVLLNDAVGDGKAQAGARLSPGLGMVLVVKNGS